jgi:hypothetical protein
MRKEEERPLFPDQSGVGGCDWGWERGRGGMRREGVSSPFALAGDASVADEIREGLPSFGASGRELDGNTGEMTGRFEFRSGLRISGACWLEQV